MLQHIAASCSVLQYFVVTTSERYGLEGAAPNGSEGVCCGVLRRVAVCCIMVHCVAVTTPDIYGL